MLQIVANAPGANTTTPFKGTKMKRFLLGLSISLFFLTPAFAEGPVGSTCTFFWDASPIVDFKEYRLYVSTTPGAQNLTTPQGPPIPKGTLTTTCAAQGITTDGQKYVVVTAVDLAGNQSRKSNEVPFVLDGMAPAAVSNLRVVVP